MGEQTPAPHSHRSLSPSAAKFLLSPIAFWHVGARHSLISPETLKALVWAGVNFNLSPRAAYLHKIPRQPNARQSLSDAYVLRPRADTLFQPRASQPYFITRLYVVMMACVSPVGVCVCSRGQSKLQACAEVWKCVPIINVSAIPATSLYAAANC